MKGPSCRVGLPPGSLLASKSAKLYGWIEPSGEGERERGWRDQLQEEEEGEREQPAAPQFSSPPLPLFHRRRLIPNPNKIPTAKPSVS